MISVRSYAVEAVRPAGAAAESAAVKTAAVPPAGAPRVCVARGAIEVAFERERTGRLDEAVAGLAEVAGDRSKSAEVRATAAALAGAFCRRARPAEAAYWVVRARELDPACLELRRLEIGLHLDAGRTKRALSLARRLAADFPDRPRALSIYSTALWSDARPARALKIAERALEAAKSVQDRVNFGLYELVGCCAYSAGKKERAVEVLREGLLHDPDEENLRHVLAALVVPDFGDHRRRRAIEVRFERANRSYRAGDHGAVKKLAQEILTIDPHDGLAHKMYCTAVTALKEKALPLVPAVSSREKRMALIAKLEEVTARAKKGRRRATPADLFPEWQLLDEVQRATVAASALGYARMIPRMIRAGARYHFALPGTPSRRGKLGDGRDLYATRGWIDPQDLRVFTGVEAIDEAARGGYNTITHELAHLVHFLLERSASGKLARYPGAIERHYQRAQQRRDGQRVINDYADSNVHEYFAESMMAELALSDESLESSLRLRERNPAFAKLCTRLADLLADFPPESPRSHFDGPRLSRSIERCAAARAHSPEARAQWERMESVLRDRTRPWNERRLRITFALEDRPLLT